MIPLTVTDHQAPVPSPSYQRGQARLGPALHIDALTLVTTLHLLALCRLAVRLAHHRCPSPLSAGPGGAPRTYCEETLLLIGLLRALWRLSYQDMHDWLKQWPALALACGLPLGKNGNPRIPSPSQQCKRRRCAGAPLYESLFVLTVLHAIQQRLIGARDLIIDSAPILAGRVFLFFRLQRPPLSHWSAIASQVALTYTASIVVALAAQRAGRPDLIRSPKRVLAHLWEKGEL